MKAIFLDIDGVLNDHRKWPNKYSPILSENVEHLNRILAEVPDAQIVLSSAWRYAFDTQKTIETLLCCHGVNCYGRVHGATCKDEEMQDEMPEYDDLEAWSSLGLTWRAGQIRRYVEKHGVTAFIALDDLDLPLHELVRTEPTIGLTDSHAAEAIARLTAHQRPSGEVLER